MPIHGPALAALSVSLLLAACSHSTSGRRPASPEVIFHVDGGGQVRVAVEVARTEAERARGLMFREHLAPGHGMLFLFERPDVLSFWMRNTYIPLDMIFVGANRRVTGIVERAEPLTDDARRVDAVSQFVVEVPGGWSAQQRIAPGTRVEFVGVD